MKKKSRHLWLMHTNYNSNHRLYKVFAQIGKMANKLHHLGLKLPGTFRQIAICGCYRK